ncbi:site-specific DNA-methyltransferase [Xanthomonas sp. H13-6]|uniref:site-specific DNA-methyltransferase (adenine-specific) n=1 Tax=Xanthomonas chitinilytica TaxID=2989819 RepID=A0ABT3JZ04_9XANT|nr:site-specific DNA-methyltransferase [Xanthomonas sp. H13-6]MCW4473683.1 site-specific DNA-methyltransferase [Xanthomonas sp. H13-6]
MNKQYDHLDRDTLIRLLQRRDAERQLGLVWERDEIEAERALNDDYVALTLEPGLSFSARQAEGRGPRAEGRGPRAEGRGPRAEGRGPRAEGRGPRAEGRDDFDAHFEGWRNLIIEGDNYDALRALRMSHKGAIRCIYIDPPYNTGNRDFVYNDRFIDKTHRFRHSLWLEFMYRRLQLAKELLADDGVIFVSIDDNELFRLGMLMDRVFGENNFVANVIWQKAYAPKNSAKHFSDDHEYIIVFAKSAPQWKPNYLPRTPGQDSAYKNPDNDPRGLWRADGMSARNYYSKGTYPVTCPSGRVVIGPPSGRYWVYSEEKFKELDRDQRIWWGTDGDNNPAVKRFLSEVKQGVVPQTLWIYSEVGHTQDAKKQLLDTLQFESSGDVFSTPKPVQLMERILRIATSPGDTVLDFFAGSGTLAQAVAKLNAEDGGNRRFILVSSTEATEDQPDKNLCRDVCAERVRKVLGGYVNAKGQAVEGLGGDFAYLRARRVPRHRLGLKLEHAEVWNALQLIHDQPLSVWPAEGFAHADGMAYLADFRASSLERLRAWLPHAVPGAALYCWSPERLRGIAAELDLRPIPHYLRERFGR